jgi:RNA polymerase-binding protein DksA
MIDTNLYKTLLETERDEILNDLKGMAVKDSLTGEYSPISDTSETEPDDLDLDNRNEEFETDSALTEELTPHLKEIEEALKKIQDGTYGSCNVCGQQIEEERLQANPSAQTCISDINS